MKDYRFELSPARLFCVAMTLLCMGVIFMFSTENADISSDTSGAVIDALLGFLRPEYRTLSEAEKLEMIAQSQHFFRKAAHFSVNLALGYFASGAVCPRKLISGGTAGVLVFCFLHACSDEFHQSFIPGRSGQLSDVLLDFSGALCGVLISAGIMQIFKKMKAPRP